MFFNRGPIVRNPSYAEKHIAAYLGTFVLFFLSAGSYYISTTLGPDDNASYFSSIGKGGMGISALLFAGMLVYRRVTR